MVTSSSFTPAPAPFSVFPTSLRKRHSMRLVFHTSFLLLASTLVACTDASDRSVTDSDSGTTPTEDAAMRDSDTTARDAGGNTDSATKPGVDSGSGTDSGAKPDKTFKANAPACFDFGTGKAGALDSPECAEPGLLQLATGEKVDLIAGKEPPGNLCLKSGTYASLAQVPVTYADCTWSQYVEGGGAGLAGAGIIVRSNDLAHHWKVRIVSNDLPTLVFSYATID